MPRSAAPLRLLQLLLVALLGLIVAAPASAADRPVKQKTKKPETPLGAARDESAVKDRPPSRFDLPAAELRLSSSELLASYGQKLELSVTLKRDAEGSLEVALPKRWLDRASDSNLPFARVPANGKASSGRGSAKRSDRVVTFDFAAGRAGDSASFALGDVGIPPGTYELPYRWRGAGSDEKGVAKVIFYAPVREKTGDTVGDNPWAKLPNPGFASNVTDDEFEDQSETFVTVVPGNPKRFVAGANGGEYSAWITNDGGQTFTRSEMPVPTDAPGGVTENSSHCCDPMSAADSTGNIWYGGLTQASGSAPSRIVVARIAPGATEFQPKSVGLPARTSGTQDKPLMTLDNSTTSPRYGTLYVVWNEPATTGGINVVISQCDTRPVGSTLDAARCDEADNWTQPVSVTPATSGYIYADVATGPDGKVYVTWWNYTSVNGIEGVVCTPTSTNQNCAADSGWGASQKIATLDSTGGTPIPFACPIVAQPGGRASTAPGVEVDYSNGPNRGRVYVTWSDLRTGSGSTKCGRTTEPATTHLSWDSFVTSRAGALPGGTGTSPTVATRLFTDGTTPSDDWFPWLVVDQTTGEAWADFYSTRHDATRQATHFYVRKVTPSSTGHTLGTLTQVSDEPSDYSDEACCDFGNQYGDYSGIDATSGVAIPIWSQATSGEDGEMYTYVGANPALVADTFTLEDTAGGDGDGKLEPGESFLLTQRLKNAGKATASTINGTLTESLSTLTLSQNKSAYPNLAPDAVGANTTKFAGQLASTAKCGDPLTMSLQVTTAQGPFTVPVTIPTGQAGGTTTNSNTADFAIPDDDPAGVTSTINLSGAGSVTDMNVKVNITHTWVEDLDIELIAPDGTSVLLATEVGGMGDNFAETVFDDEAATAIGAGTAPFTGSFRPDEPLSGIDGKPLTGAWKLKVTDWVSGDTGTLTDWSIIRNGAATCSPPPAQQRADFNGDGFSDVAAGAPGEDVGTLTDAGAVNVAYGSSTGLRTTGSQVFNANSTNVVGTASANDKFGTAVAAGNFNGDRYSDLAIGAPGDTAGTTANAGTVTILYGSATGLTGTGSELFNQSTSATGDPKAEAGDGFGSSLAAGNFGKSTTSFEDIAVGAPGEDVGTLTDAGAVSVLFAGTTGGLSTTGSQFLTQTALGANPSETGDKFGTSLAAGQLNGAGLTDLAIGVPFQNAGAVVDAGAVHVTYGGTTGLSTSTDKVFSQATASVPGDDAANDQFGLALAAGDFSGGTSAELAVGVPGKKVGTDAGAGTVVVLPGSTAGTTATGAYERNQDSVVSGVAVLDDAEPGDRFGAALAMTDLGKGTKADLVIGTPNESVGTVAQAGQVSVLYGSTAAAPSVTGNQVFNQNSTNILDTAETNDHFGSSLTVGQFGGNSAGDLIVGIPDEDVTPSGSTAKTDAGAVHLIVGSTSGGLVSTGNQWRTQGAAPQLNDVAEAADRLGAALGG